MELLLYTVTAIIIHIILLLSDNSKINYVLTFVCFVLTGLLLIYFNSYGDDIKSEHVLIRIVKICLDTTLALFISFRYFTNLKKTQ